MLLKLSGMAWVGGVGGHGLELVVKSLHKHAIFQDVVLLVVLFHAATLNS